MTTSSYRFIGTTDDVLVCGHCGRDDLRHTVVVQFIDDQGNAEDVLYLGSTCAGRYLSGRTGAKVTAADVRRGLTAAAREASGRAYRELEERTAREIAARDEVLRSWGIEPMRATVQECLAAIRESRVAS